MSARPSICFVSPQARSALLEEPGARPGGAEMQQTRLGRELARRGRDVTFAIGEPRRAGGRTPDRVDGMRVIAFVWRPGGAAAGRAGGTLSQGWRLAQSAVSLWRTMDRAGADVYTVRSNHLAAGRAGLWCRARGRPLVFAAGHDGNCDLELAHRRPRRAVALLYAAALRRAAAVVAQSEPQREMLRANFGVRAILIPSAVPAAAPRSPGSREGVLWVGAIEPRKGPDRLLEVARRLPGVTFTMVGGRGDHAVFHERVRAEASRLPNVVWLGPLPHEATLELFGRASLYLNTSRTEGFPNTFLDAWRAGAPVVSLNVDPDGPGSLERDGTGAVTGDVEVAPGAILDLLGDPRRRDAMARAGRQRVAARHALQEVAARWESVFERAAWSGGQGRLAARATETA